MYRSFRQVDRTEEYCLYDCSAIGYENRQIMYWFEDQSVKVYEKLKIEKGNGREEREIINLFFRYIVDKDFPESAVALTIDPEDARRFYDDYLKGISDRLKRILEDEQRKVLEAISGSNAYKENIEEIALLYDDLMKRHYEQGLRFYKGQGFDTVPGGPVSDSGLQPEAYEIEKMFFEAAKAIHERRCYLQLLADQVGRLMFHRPTKSLYEWNKQESMYTGYWAMNELCLSDERVRSMPGEEVPEKEETDLVNYTILSPKAVEPDSYGIIECYMYTDSDRLKVEDAIRNSDGLVKETTKTGFEVSRDTAVTVRLESHDAIIEDHMETRTWNGRFLEYDFQFYVPEDYGRNKLAFTCYIEFNGIPVTRMNFLVTVSKADDRNHIPAKVTRDDFTKAFISYSRRDEQRMLARVLGIQEMAPGLKFWLDKQSMDAGDLWRDEIRKAIQMSDLLLLFWSAAASKSVEVEKEWRYGLEQKGLEFIAPVPLDPPEICPPPEALGELNFNVRAFSMNDMTRSLSFFDSKNIYGV